MRGARLIRYCDDMVILCRGNPYPWLAKLERIITGLGLNLNAEKTRVVDAAEGFDFLGMSFRRKPMKNNPKRLFCYRWPSKRAMNGVRSKLRDAIGHGVGPSLEEKIRAINPILRGWGVYFRASNASRQFQQVDSYVYTRLVHFMRRKHKRRGKGYREYPPSFFAQAGLYHLHGTIVHGRMSQGESCRRAG